MKRSRFYNSLFGVILLASISVHAQEKQPLVEVLDHIEAAFNVKFSYASADVKDVIVEDVSEDDSLESIIAKLNAKTLLNFQFLDARYITVSTLNKLISICGILKDAETGLPIFGASVYVPGTSIGGITNASGVFELKAVPAQAEIKISFLGYKTIQLKASCLRNTGDLYKTLLMRSTTETLNTVIISKFLTAGLQKQLDGSTVLRTAKFGTLPGLTEPDILQSIQALPGVESVNESIANINVRGGTNDQNLILWDGIKMYHAGHFFGLISAYNPYLTEKVIVTKNGTSSEFSDGVSSNIIMSTKDKVNQEFSGGIGANLIHADAFFEIPISKKVALHISGRRSFTDFLSSPTYDNYFKRSFQDSEITTNSDNISDSERSSDFYFYDYTAKLLFDLNDKHHFRANVIGINNNLDYTESYQDNDGNTVSKTSNLQQRNLGAGGQWIADWSNRFQTEFSGFYSRYNVEATDYRIQTDQRLTQANEVLETGLKLKTTWRLNSKLQFINGYQYSELGILNQTTVSAPSYERTKKDVLLSHAIFNELEFKNDGTYVRAGVRTNYFQKFNKILIEPRLNFRQSIFNGVALKLQGEFKNQTANQKIDFQDDFLGVENRRWILADNKTIPISQSKQFSGGLEFKKDHWLFDIEGFYKHVKGITASNQGFYNNYQYVNASGDYDARGVEFLINKTANRFSTWLSYTYSLNDYTFESFTPSKFPNNVDIRHSMSVAVNYNISKSLEVSLGNVWHSGLPYTKPLAGNETVQDGNNTRVNYDIPNGERLPDFSRLDASVKYTFDFSEGVKGSVRAGVLNILNRQNIINRYYEVNPQDENSTIQINNTSLGLTPNMSFRVQF